VNRLRQDFYRRYENTIEDISSPPNNPVTVVCVSDAHNTKPLLPPGDLLIHAGDLTCIGTFDELQTQIDWLNAQPHKYIAGNKDLLLDPAIVDQFP
jgi:3',5'-cyclic AMP phosphodiesterase CpdA